MSMVKDAITTSVMNKFRIIIMSLAVVQFTMVQPIVVQLGELIYVIKLNVLFIFFFAKTKYIGCSVLCMRACARLYA